MTLSLLSASFQNEYKWTISSWKIINFCSIMHLKRLIFFLNTKVKSEKQREWNYHSSVIIYWKKYWTVSFWKCTKFDTWVFLKKKILQNLPDKIVIKKSFVKNFMYIQGSIANFFNQDEKLWSERGKLDTFLLFVTIYLQNILATVK